MPCLTLEDNDDDDADDDDDDDIDDDDDGVDDRERQKILNPALCAMFDAGRKQ